MFPDTALYSTCTVSAVIVMWLYASCTIEHFEPLSQYASNESSAPTSKWLFLNKPCLIDCVPPRHSPSGGCCVTASLKLQISICHSGCSAASGLVGILVKANSLQNKAIKMLRKLDVWFWDSHVCHLKQFSWNYQIHEYTLTVVCRNRWIFS